MDIDVPGLKAFVAAARWGSFTRAAESLHISQPALSRRISLVEHALGAPVFDRAGGRAQLTDVGEAFLPHAIAVLVALKDAVDAAQAVQRGDRGEVVLAVANSLLVENELRTGTLRLLNVPTIEALVPFALIRRKGARPGAAAAQLEALLADAFATEAREPLNSTAS